MKEIKNVLIKLDLEGQGIVNMDSTDQKWALQETRLRGEYHDNCTFAKKSFTKNEDPTDKNKYDYKIKISDDCMLKSAYRYDKISLVPNIVHSEGLLYAFIASPMALIQGYMFPGANLKRTGALKLSCAIQTCNAVSMNETFSRSGEKMLNDGTTDDGDTTFFKKETIGDIQYSAQGNIDLMGLQFIPCDTIMDRHQINPDYFPIYKELLKKKLPNFQSELGYYQLKESCIEVPEYGVLLSNENVNYLVKEGLKKLLIIDIKRKGSYARVKSLKIKFVVDPINDTHSNDNGWITIKTLEDVESLNFDTHMFYDSVDLKVAKQLRENLENQFEAAKKKKTEDKKLKNAKKKSKKEEK